MKIISTITIAGVLIFLGLRGQTFETQPQVAITEPTVVITASQFVTSSTLPSPEITMTALTSTTVQANPNQVCDSDCSDCGSYPIDKTHPLSSEYQPQNLVKISSNDYYQVTSETNSALVKLLDEAKKQNINLQIVSAYRSFETQKNLFAGYAKNEMAKNPNLTYEEAENKANMYSAKPGHSEHQLGTTVDLTCSGCTPFSFDEKNQKVYDFLEANANKFGFVISYPKDTFDQTGYNYEPWHIRFIGIELAQRYNQDNSNLQSKIPLSIYLQNLCNEKNN